MAADPKRFLRVFLCHASDDKPAVRTLFNRLFNDGVDAWLDEEKLLPGQDWNDEILRALQDSDAIVICLSKKSVAKEGYVQREIKEALKKAEEKPFGTIFVIPAKIDDCEVPSYLKNWHWVELFAENGHEQLMRSLRRRASEVGAIVDPLEVEALEQRLEQLYTDGLAAFHTEDWEKAYHRFKAILRERPAHTQAAQKLADVSHQRHLNALYTEALDAQKLENWKVAISALEKLTREAADYKDAAAFLKIAQKKKQLIDLYDEARRLHKAEQWQAVIAVLAKIAAIDPGYPDVDRLKDTANQRVAESVRHAELNELYSRAVREIDADRWHSAHKLLKQIQKIQFGFLETERLLVKVESEIKRATKSKDLKQIISFSRERLKTFLIVLLTLAIIVGMLIVRSGIPIKFSLSSSYNGYIYVYSDSARLKAKSGILTNTGDSFYLCVYDNTHDSYFIAADFWDCARNKHLGWIAGSYVQNKFWNYLIYKWH